jgi:hypothetical protein
MVGNLCNKELGFALEVMWSDIVRFELQQGPLGRDDVDSLDLGQ